jgi:dihydrofolate reductase
VAKLVYTAITSLDGYIEDRDGTFDWAEPDAEVHAFVNELERPVGTYLYGRRMYETMAGWETDPSLAELTPETRDYADIWRAAEKIVYSTTLDSPSTARTRIERRFDPDAVRHMKGAAEADLSISGPTLAAHGFEVGLVDEYRVFVTPIAVGGGKPAMPHGLRVRLDLVDKRRFTSGVVYLRYDVVTTTR